MSNQRRELVAIGIQQVTVVEYCEYMSDKLCWHLAVSPVFRYRISDIRRMSYVGCIRLGTKISVTSKFGLNMGLTITFIVERESNRTHLVTLGTHSLIDIVMLGSAGIGYMNE